MTQVTEALQLQTTTKAVTGKEKKNSVTGGLAIFQGKILSQGWMCGAQESGKMMVKGAITRKNDSDASSPTVQSWDLGLSQFQFLYLKRWTEMLVSRTVLSIKQYIRLAKSSFFPNHLMDFSIRWFGKKMYKLFGQPNIKHLEQHPVCGLSIDA